MWQSKRQRCFCVYTFKPLHLDVLVARLKGISESIITDIKRIKEEEQRHENGFYEPMTVQDYPIRGKEEDRA